MSEKSKEDYLVEIKKSLSKLDSKVLINLDNSPDFLTSFFAWRTYPNFRTPTERILLSRLNEDQLNYFGNYIPMIAYGFDLENISRITQNFSQAEKRKIEYVLANNRTERDKEILAERIADTARQQHLDAENVFKSAFYSIHSPVRENALLLYLENLANAYSNLSNLKAKYDETKKEDEYSDDNPSFNKIIQIYTTTKDPSLLNIIVPKYNGLIWKLLADIIKSTGLESRILEKRDLYMAGITGFIEALGKYDPSAGVRITSWTAPRVVGAIFDELRNFDLLSRSERSDFKKYKKAMKEHELDEADEAELAEIIGLSLIELRQIASLAFMKEISIDSILPDDKGDKPLTFGDNLEVVNAVDDYRSLTPEDKLYFNERSKKFIGAVKKLDKDERKVFRSYYFQNMTLKQIGSSGILGRTLSETRISQIFSSAMQKIIMYVGRNDSELSDFANNCLRTRLP